MTILKANELRIGNWANIVKSDFDLEKGNRKLEGISLHYIEMGEIEVEGVPLTEEILLKAGFILSLKWDWDKMYSKEIRLWEDENIMKINYYVIDGKNYFTTSICLLEHEYLIVNYTELSHCELVHI